MAAAAKSGYLWFALNPSDAPASPRTLRSLSFSHNVTSQSVTWRLFSAASRTHWPLKSRSTEKESLSASSSLFFYFARHISTVSYTMAERTHDRSGARHACINYERDNFYSHTECTQYNCRFGTKCSVVLVRARAHAEVKYSGSPEQHTNYFQSI